MSDFVDLIPYETPYSQRDAARKLADVIGIPQGTVPQEADFNQVVAAMAGVILYRHIGIHQRREVMETIQQFETTHRAFYGQLQGKIAMIIVQPRWEKWSLTNEELQQIVDFHRSLGRISSIAGVNPGAAGVGGTVWTMIKQGAKSGNIAGFVASVALVGLGEASYQTGENAAAELGRRTRSAPVNAGYPGN